MATPQSNCPPLELPQEIVHIIVNEVAAVSLPSDSDAVSTDTSKHIGALKVCSLISKAFYYETRIHLFNRVDLHFGQGDSTFSTQKRAARFVKVLTRNLCGANLVSTIRYLTISIHVPNPHPPTLMDKVRLRFEGKPHQIMSQAGLVKDNVMKLLEVMACSKTLDTFNLHQKPAGRHVWHRKYNPFITRICSSPLLNYLTLNGIVDLPYTVLFNIFTSESLREVTFSHMYWHVQTANELRNLLAAKSPIISKIRKLDISNTPYMHFLQALGAGDIYPPSKNPFELVVAFPQLRELVICVPTRIREEHHCVQKFMSHIASTVECLEFQYEWTQHSTIFDLSVNQLERLRDLKLTISASLFETEASQLAMIQLLPSESSIPLTSISVEIEVNLMQFRPLASTYYEEFCRVFFAPSSSWEVLDDAFTRLNLENLKKVVFDYKLVHFQMEGAQFSLSPQKEAPIDPHILFPRLSSNPSMDVQINVTSTFLPVIVMI